MSNGAQSEERDKAAYESRHCKTCCGEGMVIVLHPKHNGTRFVTVQTMRNDELVVESFPGEVAAHCGCPLGRWMRSKTAEALRARIPDVADIVEGRSLWSLPPVEDPATPPRRPRRRQPA